MFNHTCSTGYKEQFLVNNSAAQVNIMINWDREKRFKFLKVCVQYFKGYTVNITDLLYFQHIYFNATS